MADQNDSLPPHSLEAEQAVLGSMLVERDAIITALESVRSEDFFSEKHRIIFDLIQKLDAKGDVVDTITVAEALKGVPTFLSENARALLLDLAERVPTALHVEHYAKIVKEKSTLRKLIERSREIVRDANKSSMTVQELVDKAQESFFSINLEQAKRESYAVSELMHTTLPIIEELLKNKRAITGIPTGFVDLDKTTSGLHDGQLMIVAGRPGMGKTTLVMNMAEHISVSKKVPVVFFSLEMSAQELAIRLLSSRGHLDMGSLRTGYLDRSFWPKITSVAADLADAPLRLDFATSPSITEIRSASRRYAHEYQRRGQKLGCIIIDYLQLMRGEGKVESRQQEIAEISRGLKGLARELNIPVIALSQLNRKSDEREGGKPQLSDLRESGAIEQDADIVVAIYRDLKAIANALEGSEKDEARRKAQLLILKQRNGPIRDIDITFIGNESRFEDYTSEAVPAGIE
ncbi:MAG: replicative DNA helicase [Elusimicrobia bacterium]|nr:replicative DNA helicase [Elusimicrobiota bacterium]